MSQIRKFKLSTMMLVFFSLIIIGWTVIHYLEIKRSNEFRHHVFCELLLPNMSQSEVINVLSQFGNFYKTESNFAPGEVAIGINFIEPDIVDKFGRAYFLLIVRNGQFKGTRIPVPLSDSYRWLCEQ